MQNKIIKGLLHNLLSTNGSYYDHDDTYFTDCLNDYVSRMYVYRFSLYFNSHPHPG